MTDDATLSEFTSIDDAAADSSTDAGAPASETDPATETATQSTYAWGEYTCAQCEQATDRVWRDDGDLVCPNCKAW